jgi:hypothetical protein
MKTALAALSIAVLLATGAEARTAPKSALDHDPDMFAVVTPDRLLGTTTRRQWLTLYPVLGREYWAAWDCKGKLCDTAKRKHIRETAKLITRTDADPKPVDSPPSSSSQ